MTFVGNRTEAAALQQKLRGVLAMPSVAYFRRQADICFRLALIASDEEVSNRLIMMAKEYTAKGDALAKRAGADVSARVDPAALPGMEEDDPVLNSPPNAPDPSADR
jgi:hypothetical protein